MKLEDYTEKYLWIMGPGRARRHPTSDEVQELAIVQNHLKNGNTLAVQKTRKGTQLIAYKGL
jgi:hypothetical protein